MAEQRNKIFMLKYGVYAFLYPRAVFHIIFIYNFIYNLWRLKLHTYTHRAILQFFIFWSKFVIEYKKTYPDNREGKNWVLLTWGPPWTLLHWNPASQTSPAISFLASSDSDLRHLLPWEHSQRSACALLMQISGQRMASSLVIQLGKGWSGTPHVQKMVLLPRKKTFFFFFFGLFKIYINM